MKILGKEYGLLYTVGAQKQIADLKNEPNPQQTAVAAKIPLILSEWHEKAESMKARAEGREYTQQPLTMEEIELLTINELNELLMVCDRVMAHDCGRTVETDEAEKKTDAPTGGSLS